MEQNINLENIVAHLDATNTNKFEETIESVKEELNKYREENVSLSVKLDESNKSIQNTRALHIKDIQKIGEALITEADNRGWCEAYDDFVNNLNSQLTYSLPTRTKNYEVKVLVTLTRTQVVTISVDDVQSEEEAVDEAVDKIENYIDDYVNDYNWDDDIDTEVQRVEEV